MNFKTFLIISISAIALMTPIGYLIVMNIFDTFDMDIKSEVLAQAWETNKERSIQFVIFGIPVITFIIGLAFWFILLREPPKESGVMKE